MIAMRVVADLIYLHETGVKYGVDGFEAEEETCLPVYISCIRDARQTRLSNMYVLMVKIDDGTKSLSLRVLVCIDGSMKH